MYDSKPAIEWVLAEEPEQPRCGARRGPQSKTYCELPPDHMVGRLPGEPVREHFHIGRSPAGHWYSWPPKAGA